MNYFHQYHTETQIIHNQKICFAPHLHDEVEIITLFRGSASLTADGLSYTLSAGDFVIIFPDVVHGYAFENNVDVGKFIFSPGTVPETFTIGQLSSAVRTRWSEPAALRHSIRKPIPPRSDTSSIPRIGDMDWHRKRPRQYCGSVLWICG